ncbi:SAM-dependent methyltransferase [Pseudomonas aeruginosa]|nr:SAM-dependent methyltransferase [Pseudomonas aeruginosa]
MTLACLETDGQISAPNQKEQPMNSSHQIHELTLPKADAMQKAFGVNAAGELVPYTEPEHVVAQLHEKLKNILKPLDLLYPIEQRLDLGPYVHWRGNATSPMHRWLRYREAYSPELIDKLQLGNRILDPFSGCGSIPIGAAIRGKSSVGIDLNPIAAFSTKVKLTPLKQSSICKIKDFLADLPALILVVERWPLPELSISEKVFEPQMLDAVLRARTAIERVFADDSLARDFVFLAWLAILEGVGSYFKEGNGIKYRNKKRQKGKYEDRADGEWQLKRFGSDQRAFFLKVFTRQLRMMLEDATEWESGNWDGQRLIEGSAFDLAELLDGDTFDSVIFSPPYANRFDYFESFKVELWFGNFVNSYADLNALRKASLRSHLNADFKRPSDNLPALEELILLMDRSTSSWRMGVPDLMRGYFHDMGIVLRQCRKVLPNGRCHVVVGNSAFAGVIIPTDVLTAMVGINAGFKRAKIVETRHLTVAPQQRNILKGFEQYMRESIVVLE